MGEFSDKVIVVTGAGRSHGKVMAVDYAEET